MFSFPFLSGLLRGGQSHMLSPQAFTFTPGQILAGEIVKLFPDQSALVKFGTVQVQAKLEIPISVGQKSWFQVQDKAEPITLKILPQLGQVPQTPISSLVAGNSVHQSALAPMMTMFGLKKTDKNMEIIRFFIDHKLPMNKEALKVLSSLAHETSIPTEQLLHTSKAAILRGLPITSEVITSAHHFLFNPPVHQQLKELIGHVSSLGNSVLKEELEGFLSKVIVSEPTGESLAQSLRSIGMESERTLKTTLNNFLLSNQEGSINTEVPVPLDSLKSLLQKVLSLQQIPPSIQEKTETMIHQITGQQLFIQSDTTAQSPFLQMLFQFPIELQNQSSLVQAQMEGRKKANGGLDPENCRLLFFLQLQSLGETVVDVHIVNKLISVVLYSHSPQRNLLLDHKSGLVSALTNLGYSLASVSWKESQSQPKGMATGYSSLKPSSYQGVDIKI